MEVAQIWHTKKIKFHLSSQKIWFGSHLLAVNMGSNLNGRWMCCSRCHFVLVRPPVSLKNLYVFVCCLLPRPVDAGCFFWSYLLKRLGLQGLTTGLLIYSLPSCQPPLSLYRLKMLLVVEESMDAVCCSRVKVMPTSFCFISCLFIKAGKLPPSKILDMYKTQKDRNYTQARKRFWLL